MATTVNPQVKNRGLIIFNYDRLPYISANQVLMLIVIWEIPANQVLMLIVIWDLKNEPLFMLISSRNPSQPSSYADCHLRFEEWTAFYADFIWEIAWLSSSLSQFQGKPDDWWISTDLSPSVAHNQGFFNRWLVDIYKLNPSVAHNQGFLTWWLISETW